MSEQLQRLVQISRLPEHRAKAALDKAGGDVDQALVAQIDAGLVDHTDLDPDLAGPQFFGRVNIRNYLRTHEDMLRRFAGRPGLEEFQRNVDNARAALLDPAKLSQWGKTLHEQAMLRKHPELAKQKAAAEKKAAKSIPQKLTLEPFPPLKRSSDEWTGEDVINQWTGFGPGKRKARPKVKLRIVPPDDAPKGAPPTPQQIAAYKHLKSRAAGVIDAVLDAIFAEYPKWRKNYDADQMQDEDDFHMPPIKKRDELKALIQPDEIILLQVAREKTAYLGISLSCTWDDEHGVGVLLHKSRVVETGHADIAFNDKLAAKDAR